jgi:hippurate hydrolase
MDVEELVNWRRDLHQIPELGLKEYQTKAYLKKELEKMGYYPSEILETGLYIYIDQGKEETIAFRSDMDALPITEMNDIPFKSKHEGCMHACGHDGHMTALLGFAKRLSEEEHHFAVNLLLIFQPAEEAPGAAKMIVESGLLKKYNVKAIYGIHLMPTLQEGTLASKAGGLMAECGEIDVTIHGKDAHAGMPHLGVDAIMIASILLNQYQQILTRMKTPFEPAIINIGEIHGGQARNSVASTCELHGTVRTYSDEIFDLLMKKIDAIHKGAETAYGCQIDWSCPPMYPAVINDARLFRHAQSVCQLKELKEPLMLAEDFAFYQKAVPGLFVFVGTRTKEYTSGLHTDRFNFNEKVLMKAVDMYMSIASNWKGDILND